MEEEDDEVMVREGLMASQREIFSISGPIHLTSIDWNNSYHRTSVASCLVQAVYTLERDRQQNRIGLKSQANHWWEFFQLHFSRNPNRRLRRIYIRRRFRIQTFLLLQLPSHPSFETTSSSRDCFPWHDLETALSVT